MPRRHAIPPRRHDDAMLAGLDLAGNKALEVEVHGVAIRLGANRHVHENQQGQGDDRKSKLFHSLHAFTARLRGSISPGKTIQELRSRSA